MSDAIETPNAVGRLDQFTEAAARGDKDGALAILDAEIARRLSQFGIADSERKKADEAYYAVKTYRSQIAKSDNEAWFAARRSCGWTGDDAGAAEGAKVMRVEELQKGDVIFDGNEHLVFQVFDEDGDLEFCSEFGVVIHGFRELYDECLKRGIPVYRTIDGVRTLISGWPADKHPAVEEAARQREENAKLKNEISCWMIATECGGGEENQCESYGELSERFDDLESLIEQQKAEIERLKAAMGEPELDEARVIRTIYEIAGQRDHGSTSASNLWASLRCIIRSIYSGFHPHFKPYNLKK